MRVAEVLIFEGADVHEVDVRHYHFSLFVSALS